MAANSESSQIPDVQKVDSRPGVYVKTFGCQMNEYDSEKMLALLSATHRPVQQLDQAEVVIVNTCSVRDKAESKLYDLLGVLRDLKATRPELVIGVGGCVAQQEGTQILRRSRRVGFGVDFVVGTHNLSLIPSLVDAAKGGAAPQVAVDYREEWEDLPAEFDAAPRIAEVEQRERTSSFGAYYSPVRALVAIQRGCDKNCAYCVVPTTRGAEVSRAPEEIEREVRQKVRLGAREVMLLGQTVNSYGRDLTPRYPFARLVERLSEIEGLARIRFTSPHPAEVRPEFIRLYAQTPKLVPHIHLPLQSGSDRILKLMNRNYRVERYREIVRELRQAAPEIAISSDFIVGFPTESAEDFEATLEMVREIRFHHAYCFKYSRRPNTAALTLFQTQEEIAESVKRERLGRLIALQDCIALELNQELVGKEVEVLVEGPGKHISSAKGRTPQNTLVIVDGLESTVDEGVSGYSEALVGALLRVQIEQATAHTLRGRAIQQ